MATLYDNLVIQEVVTGDNCSASIWYTRVNSGGTSVWTGKDAQAGYAASSDYYITLSTVNADSDSAASPEADSYATDSSGRTDHTFVIDGGDILTYSTTNIIKANKGSIAFMWKAPLPYNKYTANFYLVYLHQFMAIHYSISDSKFYFQIYNGTNWSTAKVLSNAQTFGSSDWIKICATWDTSSATTMSFYIDSSTPDGTYASTWTEQAVPATLYVGGYHTSISQSDGTFDELRIYSEAITAAEVETLFNTTWDW